MMKSSLSRFIRRFFALLTRLVLRLRYKIEIKAPDSFSSTEGVLILPNHPAEIDPVILMSVLTPRLDPHPMAVEDFYFMPGLHLLMKLLRVLPVPNMETGAGSYKRMRLRRSLDQAADWLNAGENLLIYPAGRLMHSGREDLRAASGVTEILHRVRDPRVVLVRTRGLIGSSFSWPVWQRRPQLEKCLLNGAKTLLVNLLFFTPRRQVQIEIIEAPADFPAKAEREFLNAWLEAWYNAPGEEPLTRPPYAFWQKTAPEIIQAGDEKNDETPVAVPAKLRQKLINELSRISGRDASEIRENGHLARDLGFDSLATAEFAAWLQGEFYILDLDTSELETVGDCLTAAAGGSRDGAQKAISPEIPPPNWRETRPRPSILPPDPERLIPEIFFETCRRAPNAPAIADEISGVLRYRRLRLSVVILAEVIRRRCPESHIGILLPASTGAAVVILAALTAGKVPVLINWTMGDANFEQVIQTAGLKMILSSGRFLDRIDSIDFERFADWILPLEDLARKKIGWRQKLSGLLLARRASAVISRHFGLDQLQPDSPAVILFTSGSEAAPKGVPLSHRNILSNIQASLDAIHLKSEDVLYGFLPPFHSFGFTITTILPLVCGLKTAFYPNPTESRKLVRGIAKWRPSLLCGTPTFLTGILRAGDSGSLSSLELLLTGAEKAPDELFLRARDLCGATVLEGYGITECSPVLTIQRIGDERVGVGRAIGDVEIKIIDLNTSEELPPGEQGMIIVRGSSIFHGYLTQTPDDAFIKLDDGPAWYRTGDLGILDEHDNLILTGRLKRFVKIGGEMISLPAMEHALLDRLPQEPDSEGPVLALASRENPGERPWLCLFTTLTVTRDQVNAVLRDAGFSNLARIQDVQKMTAIPLLGSGKTDYVTLSNQLQQKND